MDSSTTLLLILLVSCLQHALAMSFWEKNTRDLLRSTRHQKKQERNRHNTECQNLENKFLKNGMSTEMSVAYRKLCDGNYSGEMDKDGKRVKRQAFESVFIVPGTKWCGWGNISSHENDLGIYNVTDACCRTHDHCPHYAVSSIGLTRRSCECEKEFYDCLVQALDHEPEVANKTGNLYFNTLDMDCVTVETRKKCVKWSLPSWLSWFSHCEEYSLDETENVQRFVENKHKFPVYNPNSTTLSTK